MITLSTHGQSHQLTTHAIVSLVSFGSKTSNGNPRTHPCPRSHTNIHIILNVTYTVCHIHIQFIYMTYIRLVI